jgi:hypothetical protein
MAHHRQTGRINLHFSRIISELYSILLPGNHAETESTNIGLQRWKKLVYSNQYTMEKDA